MALESTKNINIDFYDNRYVLINAKQYDGNSRYITVTCYDQGKIFNLSSAKHTAYVRYKKPDGHIVFNFCTITTSGQVGVELTEQMLSTSGICDVDLVIIHKGNAVVNIDTGEIVTIDDSAIISTMVFRIYVYESAVDNSLIESFDEYNGLNDLLTRAEANYQQVINASEIWALNSQSWAIGGTGVEGRAGVEDTDNAKYYNKLSRSYAIGDADDIRSNEDIDNAKYYSEQSSDSADKSESYAVGGTGTRDGEDEDNAKYYSIVSQRYTIGGTNTVDGEDEDNAKYYYKESSKKAESASESEKKALEYRNLSQSYAIGDSGIRDDESTDNSQYYSELSKSYAIGGSGIETRSNEDTDNAEYYSRLAKSYTIGNSDGSTETRDDEEFENAKSYMQATEGYMDNAELYMNNSISYAVGGTGIEGRENEDTDNAKYYYEQSLINATSAKTYAEEVRAVVDGLDSGFIPMGTITFAELATAAKATGYVYNISDDFITTSDFREGEGKSYTAGTNVYFCADGMWDAFGGASSPTATVDEVKTYLGI